MSNLDAVQVFREIYEENDEENRRLFDIAAIKDAVEVANAKQAHFIARFVTRYLREELIKRNREEFEKRSR